MQSMVDVVKAFDAREQRRWLIRNRGKRFAAHIWLGSDTACGMWSTGGMKQSRFEVRGDRGNHEVCHMCQRARVAE